MIIYIKIIISIILIFGYFYFVFAIPRKTTKYYETGNIDGIKRLKLYDYIFAIILFSLAMAIENGFEKKIFIQMFIVHIFIITFIKRISNADTSWLSQTRINKIILIFSKREVAIPQIIGSVNAFGMIVYWFTLVFLELGAVATIIYI